jgi:hypothetical protein
MILTDGEKVVGDSEWKREHRYLPCRKCGEIKECEVTYLKRNAYTCYTCRMARMKENALKSKLRKKRNDWRRI